jgi:hypothetical protein
MTACSSETPSTGAFTPPDQHVGILAGARRPVAVDAAERHHARGTPHARRMARRELRRVTRGRIVLLTHDPVHRPWLTDYLPELAALDEKQMPAMSDYERWLGFSQITPVMVPHNCSDGFLYAYWRRPAAYLDPHVRSGSSSFWAIGNAAEAGLQDLRRDLETGEWERRYAKLLALDEYDAGYRLVIAE